MKKIIYPLLCSLFLFSAPGLQAQDPLSDCEIYMDELELQLKKDQKDIEKYYQTLLEDGNAIFKKDLQSINSNREKRDLRKKYKTYIQGLEKDFNKEMDDLEDIFVESLEGLREDCGSRAVRRRIALFMESRDPYYNRRPSYY